MRLPDLKYDFANLSVEEQRIVFYEYYDLREKEVKMPPRRSMNKKKASSGAKGINRQKTVTLSQDQINLLKKLKLL